MSNITRLLLIITLTLYCLTGCRSEQIYKRSQLLMGTIADISVVSSDPEHAHAAITKGFREIKRLEDLFSTYKEKSEISRINLAAGKKPVRVSPETLDLLEKSLLISQYTNGAFNIAAGTVLKAWNIPNSPRKDGRLPSEELLNNLRGTMNSSKIIIDTDAKTVFLSDADVSLDPGGIAKGYTVDKVVELLKKEGISAALVAIAGDIKAFGKRPDGKAWTVGIRSPREDGLIKEIELNDQAISTSGDYERYFEKDGKRYHHIIDPATLRPATRSQSVSVISQHGYLSDGLSTGLFIMGHEKAPAVLKGLPGTSALFVDANGILHSF